MLIQYLGVFSFFVIIISLLLFLNKERLYFFKDSFSELKSIDWLNGKKILYLTLLVLITMLLVSTFIWGIDNILVYLISYISSCRSD